MASNTKNQYLAGIFVNIISISFGAFIGWGSPSFIELQSDESPLESGPLSNTDAGWIGSMLCIGTAIGTVFCSWCADVIGRKRCMLLQAIPLLLAWWIIPFAKTPLHLTISRFLGGFTGGGIFAVIPIYTAELSEDSVRGSLGTILVVCCNMGVLLAFIFGNFFSYSMLAWILSPLPLVFLVCFAFIPESPQYLASRNNLKEAERSLRYFRNVSRKEMDMPSGLKIELENLLDKSTDATNGANVGLKDFCERKVRKAMIIGIGVVALSQFCGCFAMLNYTASLFKESGSNLSPNLSAIIVGAVQLLGSYVATILVERAGRKILLTISAIGTGIGHICLGAFVCMGDRTTSSWMAVASFSFIIFIACWGIITLPYVVIAEVLPPHVRNQGCMICMLTLATFSFILLKYMNILMEILGLHGVLFFFAACCFVGAAFVVFFVPETKGKPIEEILEKL